MEKKKLVSRAEIKQFIKDNGLKSVEDVQNVLKGLFAETLQEMLEAELDTTLSYEKNDGHNKRTNNRRNGHSAKTVRSEFGEIDIQIPRDREGEHDPLIVKKHQKNVTGIEDQVLALYAKGVSTRDIQDHLERVSATPKCPIADGIA
jgi:transposase-like protein